MTSITLTPRAEREQRAFRQLLDVHVAPGSSARLPLQPHAGEWGVAVSAIEALVDHEVTFCVVPERTELSDIVLRQTGSRLATLENADYVLCDTASLLEVLRRSKDGTLEYPDRGATVVCLVQSISASGEGEPLVLAGPGIKDTARVWVEGFDAAAGSAFTERNADVPLGVDLVLVAAEGGRLLPDAIHTYSTGGFLMGYTAVRGGLDAIEQAEALVDSMPLASDEPLKLSQLERHMQIAIARVMAEGGLNDVSLAALAIKQAEGDVIEAAFLLRAYRSTLPRLGYSHATGGEEMLVLRRVSSVFRDIPGGQLLGLTRDYTQRLLNFELADEASPPPSPAELARGFSASV